MKRILLIISLLSINLGYSQFWNTNGNSGTTPSSNFIGNIDNQDLIIKTNNSERIKISSDGNILMNLVQPVSKDGLDIVCNTENMNEGTDIVWIKSKKPQTNDVGILTLSTYNWQYPIFSARENGKILVGIAHNNTKMVNCSDCSEYRMFVKDGIKAEKVKVEVSSTSGWADFVFSKDYQLPKLEEVEKHIKDKGHLPDIPSAKEVVKNGINLGEMDSKLLQKIEELTLYSIEQNKKIKELEEKIEKLINK